MSADKKSGTNKRIRLSLDIAMTIILPMLMAYSLIGEVFHEVIGTLMFVLFIIHCSFPPLINDMLQNELDSPESFLGNPRRIFRCTVRISP